MGQRVRLYYSGTVAYKGLRQSHAFWVKSRFAERSMRGRGGVLSD